MNERGYVMPDIAALVNHLGLAKYTNTFLANEVDLATLQHLSDSDLRELGLPVGARRKILAALASEVLPKAPPPIARRNEPERRPLTVMFIDLVGSTELSRQFD